MRGWGYSSVDGTFLVCIRARVSLQHCRSECVGGVGPESDPSTSGVSVTVAWAPMPQE